MTVARPFGGNGRLFGWMDDPCHPCLRCATPIDQCDHACCDYCDHPFATLRETLTHLWTTVYAIEPEAEA